MALLRQSLKRISQSRAFGWFVNLLENRDDSRQNLLRVLTYHRVDHLDQRPHLCPGMISATPEAFREQMQHLKRGYRVVSIWEVLESLETATALPPRAVLVTFDDAYRDFAEQAWPILRELKLPVTLFVPTGFPDAPGKAFWWDRLYRVVCKSEDTIQIATPWGESIVLETADQRLALFKKLKSHLKTRPHKEAMFWVEEICRTIEDTSKIRVPETNDVLGWQELRELAREGVVLAPHTINHPLLNRVDPGIARKEADGSLRDLKSHLSEVPPVLAYPAGGVNPQAMEEIREAGIRLAFTTQRGINDLSNACPLQLRRTNVGQGTTLSLFRAQLLPQMRHLAGRL